MGSLQAQVAEKWKTNPERLQNTFVSKSQINGAGRLTHQTRHKNRATPILAGKQLQKSDKPQLPRTSLAQGDLVGTVPSFHVLFTESLALCWTPYRNWLCHPHNDSYFEISVTILQMTVIVKLRARGVNNLSMVIQAERGGTGTLFWGRWAAL